MSGIILMAETEANMTSLKQTNSERSGHMNILIALVAMAAVVLTGKYTYRDIL